MRKTAKKYIRVVSLFLTVIFLFLLLTSCNISFGTEEGKEEIERVKGIEKTLEKAVLQYPTKNGEFFYNVYDTHVAITKYIGEGGDVIVPAQIEELPVYVIETGAFKGSAVTNVIIEEGIAKIKSQCFAKCESLQTIQLPESLFFLGEDTFSSCSSLTEITFPKSISTIPYSVCYECTSLKTVTILTETANSKISSMAFLRCTSLENVYITGAVSEIYSDAFEEVSENIIFHGPVGCTAAKFCAENFYEYSVVKVETDDPEATTECEETTFEETDRESESSSEEDDEEISKGGSILTLIVIALIFFGIIGGLIAFLIIRRRRE